jgi:hypothetical protein
LKLHRFPIQLLLCSSLIQDPEPLSRHI